ncbi:tRNA (adenosine(37)-N6)-threonylcarbamoyltransferase complex ATPase subunit type 1 TsaE [Fervidibacillus halotolerans]|uniref:tRNA threonylcarbamoyladenosine biosynthesis protein TsaE n=1 Tax=Fervidibacillus halotolerans TaxID=2980027 RepID=A0A9E8LZA5_9BACI|nr:tRNA (adenosine(37)-N6)-threonylcarbamoyltransferase complex ATPase subunit type 1 TsaE [Fervidibacillus halotolerans]WAA12568.1 tRNA (adenosine(37)-N6)-threonylcarbamoyltransferase complex ATPase subunit type 1 TsaE [Fervidibacillus halotolerans]
MKYEITVNGLEETKHLAKSLAFYLQSGDVIALEGDLGAGKTSFTKGLAEGLDIHQNVNSPTFTIIKEYMGRLPLYHMDVYRLDDSEEDLGFDEYFHGDGITVVEWAHKIQEQLPEERLTIEFYTEGEFQRRIVFSPSGKRYNELCEEFFHERTSN